MEIISHGAEAFIALFQEGGKILVNLMKGILPMLITLLVVVNALVKFIGEDQLEKLSKKAAKSSILRLIFLPAITWTVLGTPMVFSMARFLPERYKASFFEVVSSGEAHPFTGLFPHTNPGELFVWLGIATGIQKLGLPIGGLAVRYALAGMIIGFIRGFLTDKLWVYFAKKKGLNIEEYS